MINNTTEIEERYKNHGDIANVLLPELWDPTAVAQSGRVQMGIDGDPWDKFRR